MEEKIDKQTDRSYILNKVTKDSNGILRRRMIACGQSHTLCLTKNSKLYSFGDNSLGQLGDNLKKLDNRFVNEFLLEESYKENHVIQSVDSGQNFSAALLLTTNPKQYATKLLVWGHLSNETTVGNINYKEDGSETVIDTGFIEMLFEEESPKVFIQDTKNLEQLINFPSEKGIDHELEEKVIDFACGKNFIMVLWVDGSVFAIGDNQAGQAGIGQSLNDFLFIPRQVRINDVDQVACGAAHTVFRTTNGSVQTCGDGEQGQLGHGGVCLSSKEPRVIDSLTKVNIAKVQAGEFYSGVISNKNRVFMFGMNQSGCLGLSNEVDMFDPTHVTQLDDMNVRQLALGSDHTLALTSSGAVQVWGSNRQGKLGLGDSISEQEPVQQPTEITNKELFKGSRKCEWVSVGAHHSVIVVGGSLFAFGFNADSRLGKAEDELAVKDPLEVKGISGFQQNLDIGYDDPDQETAAKSSVTNEFQTAVGAYHKLIKLNNYLFIQGEKNKNVLGLTRAEINDDSHQNQPRLQPYFVRESKIIKKVAAGNSHSLLLTNDNQVFAWGDNKFRQMCMTKFEWLPEPIEVPEMRGTIDIACGEYFSLTLTQERQVKATGINSLGQLGRGGNQVSTSLESVIEVRNAYQINAGFNHAMAICLDDEQRRILQVWGNGASQQLGNGKRDNQFTPLQVDNARDPDTKIRVEFSMAAGGNQHTVAIDALGRLWGWGQSIQVGKDSEDVEVPQLIDKSQRWKDAVCGDEHTFLIDKRDQIWALGFNRNEKLGIKNQELLLKPTPFIVNQEIIENSAVDEKKVTDDSDIQDFTHAHDNNQSSGQEIKTKYTVKSVATYRDLSIIIIETLNKKLEAWEYGLPIDQQESNQRLLNDMEIAEDEKTDDNVTKDLASVAIKMLDITEEVDIFDIKEQINLSGDKSVEVLDAEYITALNLIKFLTKTYRSEYDEQEKLRSNNVWLFDSFLKRNFQSRLELTLPNIQYDQKLAYLVKLQRDVEYILQILQMQPLYLVNLTNFYANMNFKDPKPNKEQVSMLQTCVKTTVSLFSIQDEFASVAHAVNVREHELLLKQVDLVVANEIVNVIDFESLFVGICSPFKTILLTLLSEEYNLSFYKEIQPFQTQLQLQTSKDHKFLNFEDLDDDDESKSGKMNSLRKQTELFITTLMKSLENLPTTARIAISLMNYQVHQVCKTRFKEINLELAMQKCVEVTFEKILGEFFAFYTAELVKDFNVTQDPTDIYQQFQLSPIINSFQVSDPTQKQQEQQCQRILTEFKACTKAFDANMMAKDDLNTNFKLEMYKTMKSKFVSFFVRKDNIYPALGSIEAIYEIQDPIITLPTLELSNLLMDIIDFRSQEEGKGEVLWRAMTIKKQYTIDPLYKWIESKQTDDINELRANLAVQSSQRYANFKIDNKMLVCLSEDDPLTLCPVTNAIVEYDQVGIVPELRPPGFNTDVQANLFYRVEFTLDGKDGFQTVFNKFIRFHDPIVIKFTTLLKLLEIDRKLELSDLTDFKKQLNKINNSDSASKKLKLAIEEFQKVVNDPVNKEKYTYQQLTKIIKQEFVQRNDQSNYIKILKSILAKDKEKKKIVKSRQEKLVVTDEILRNISSNRNWDILECIRGEWRVLTMAFQHQVLLQSEKLRSSSRLAIPLLKVNLNQPINNTIENYNVEILANNVKRVDQPVIQLSIQITNEGNLNFKIKKNTSLLVKKDLTFHEQLLLLEYPYIEQHTAQLDKIKFSTGKLVQQILESKREVQYEDHQ